MRIGVDVGGTFTDLVVADPKHGLQFVKTPSTPSDPSKGVVDGLALMASVLGKDLQTLLSEAEVFIHGTTVATNILVQQNGARLGLITSAGFRDLLEFRDGSKAERYKLRVPFPEPFVPRPLRLEVTERIRYDGSVETPINQAEIETAIAELRKAGVESVIVCFLHAHRAPAHELLVRQKIVESGWDVYVSLSHEVLSKEGEYERLSTTVANSYVGPGLNSYLLRLKTQLEAGGVRTPVLIMQSSGGVLPIEDAGRKAVGAVTSGPAGGAMAGTLFARLNNLPNVVTYDMGGTSTDICIIENGRAVERQKTEVNNLKIGIPAVEVNALGAGGGSVARIDAGGILDLGPESVGADPGPACYMRGGTKPATADANVTLGYVSPDTFLGGRLRLSREAAVEAIQRVVGEPLGLSPEAAAYAIHQLATSKITAGIRLATVRRGMDPRDYALISFGGAGGVHANAVARELRIPRVIIPRQASVLSALGFLAADVRHDLQRTVSLSLSGLDVDRLRGIFEELEEQGRSWLKRDGFSDEQIRSTLTIDCRYSRQIHSIPVAIEWRDLKGGPEQLQRKFEAAYEALYHHSHAGEIGVIDNCRLAVFGELPKLELPIVERSEEPSPASAYKGKRAIYLGEWMDADVYWFDDLKNGMQVVGPALIDSASTTILVLPGSIAEVDTYGSLCITTMEGDQQ